MKTLQQLKGAKPYARVGKDCESLFSLLEKLKFDMNSNIFVQLLALCIGTNNVKKEMAKFNTEVNELCHNMCLDNCNKI